MSKDKRNSERVGHLLKIFNPSHQIKSYLDIGCGNKEITHEIADVYKIKEVHGADVYPILDPVVVENSSTIMYHQVVDNNIDVVDNSIDLITCFMSIHHFDDFSAMMREISRVLRQKGFLFLREHNVPIDNLALKKYLDERHLQYPDHPLGSKINYWSRLALQQELTTVYNFKYVDSSDYPVTMKNPQAIYHSLFIKS